jgi:hypothetical protein
MTRRTDPLSANRHTDPISANRRGESGTASGANESPRCGLRQRTARVERDDPPKRRKTEPLQATAAPPSIEATTVAGPSGNQRTVLS